MHGRKEPLGRLEAPPVFIGGHERSGTTWVFDLMSAHPEVAGLFETWMFSPHHGIGGVFAREQWDEEHVKAAGGRVGRPFGLHQMLSRDELAMQVRELVAGWMTGAMAPEHRYVVEKTPPHLLGMDMIAEVIPEARFVHVIRDGRDVAVSVRAAVRSWNPGLRSRSGRSFADDARSWRSTVEAISAAGRRHAGRYIEVRYEDVHRDVSGSARRLFDFAGIPVDDDALERIVAEAHFDSHSASGDDSFRRAGRTGDWRTELGPLDARRFERVAGDTLIALGYEDQPGWWRKQLTPRRRGSRG